MTQPDDLVRSVNITPETQAVLLVFADGVELGDIGESLRSMSEYLGVPVAAVNAVDHVCVIELDDDEWRTDTDYPTRDDMER